MSYKPSSVQTMPVRKQDRDLPGSAVYVKAYFEASDEKDVGVYSRQQFV